MTIFPISQHHKQASLTSHLSTLLFLIFFVSICFVSCFKGDLHSIMPKDIELKPGDIVFRLGNSMESTAVVMADRNGEYSHCGIVVDSAGQIRIVHAVPDEPDFDGDVDRVKMDRPEMFWRNDRAVAGGFCRMENDTVAPPKAAEAAKAAFYRNTLFDDNYDDKDTTKLYCSELLYYAYLHAGYDIAGPERHSYNVIIQSFDSVIMPSQIYKSKYFKPVRVFSE